MSYGRAIVMAIGTIGLAVLGWAILIGFAWITLRFPLVWAWLVLVFFTVPMAHIGAGLAADWWYRRG